MNNIGGWIQMYPENGKHAISYRDLDLKSEVVEVFNSLKESVERVFELNTGIDYNGYAGTTDKDMILKYYNKLQKTA